MVPKIYIDGWNIPVNSLGNFRPNQPFYFSASKQFDTAILIYNITDIRMGTPAGNIKIFRHKKSPKLIDDKINLLALYYKDDTIFWFKHSPILVIKQFYNGQDTSITKTPLLLIDIEKNLFTCMKSKRGFPLEIEEKDKNSFILKEKKWSSEKKNMSDITNEKIVSLNSLSWHKFPLNNEIVQKIIDGSSFYLK